MAGREKLSAEIIEKLEAQREFVRAANNQGRVEGIIACGNCNFILYVEYPKIWNPNQVLTMLTQSCKGHHKPWESILL